MGFIGVDHGTSEAVKQQLERWNDRAGDIAGAVPEFATASTRVSIAASNAVDLLPKALDVLPVFRQLVPR